MHPVIAKHKYHITAGVAVAIVLALVFTTGVVAWIFVHNYKIGDTSFSCTLGDYGCVENHMKPDGVVFHNKVTYSIWHSGHNPKTDKPDKVFTGTNTVTAIGKTCTLALEFNINPTTTIGNQTCNANRLAGWGGNLVIGLINSSHTVIVNGSDTPATSKQNGGTRVPTGFKGGVIYTANQGAPVACAVTFNAYNSITCTSSSIAIGAGQLGAGGTVIGGAVLANATSSTVAIYFAEQTFGQVTLVNGDSVIVAWTVTD